MVSNFNQKGNLQKTTTCHQFVVQIFEPPLPGGGTEDLLEVRCFTSNSLQTFPDMNSYYVSRCLKVRDKVKVIENSNFQVFGMLW